MRPPPGAIVARGPAILPGRTDAATLRRRQRAAAHQLKLLGAGEATGGKPPDEPTPPPPPQRAAIPRSRANPVEVRFLDSHQRYATLDATQPVPQDIWAYNRERTRDDLYFEARGPWLETTAGAMRLAEVDDWIDERYCANYDAYVAACFAMRPNARVKYAKSLFTYTTKPGVLKARSTNEPIKLAIAMARRHPNTLVVVSSVFEAEELNRAQLPNPVSVMTSIAWVPRKAILVGMTAYENWLQAAQQAHHRVRARLYVMADESPEFDEEKEHWEDESDYEHMEVRDGVRIVDLVEGSVDLVNPLIKATEGWTGPVKWKVTGMDWQTYELPERLWDSRVLSVRDEVDTWDIEETRFVTLAPRLRGGMPPKAQPKPRRAAKPARAGGAAAEAAPDVMVIRPQTTARTTAPKTGRKPRRSPTITPSGRARPAAAPTGATTDLHVEKALADEAEADAAAVAAVELEDEVTADLGALIDRGRCVHTCRSTSRYSTTTGHDFCSRGVRQLSTLVSDEFSARSRLCTAATETEDIRAAFERDLTSMRDVHNHLRAALLRHPNNDVSTFRSTLSTTHTRFPTLGRFITMRELEHVADQVNRDVESCATLEAKFKHRSDASKQRVPGASVRSADYAVIASYNQTACDHSERIRVLLATARAAVSCYMRVNRWKVALTSAALSSIAAAWRAKWRRTCLTAAVATGIAVLLATTRNAATARNHVTQKYLTDADSLLFEQETTFIRPVEPTRNESVCLGQPPKPDVFDPNCPVDPSHVIRRWPDMVGCDNPGQFGGDLFGPAFCWAQVARSCMCNCCNALVNRHAARRPPCLTPLVSTWDDCDHRLASAVAGLYAVRAAEVEESWYDWFVGPDGPTTRATKWTSAMILKFVRSWSRDPPDPGRTDGFPKREISKACFDHHDTGRLTKARLIHPPTFDYAKEILGREFAAWQKALCDVANPTSPYEYSPGVFISIACGVGKGEVADWAAGSALWYLESDGSTWDALVNDGMVDYKHEHMRVVSPRIAAFAEGYRTTPVNVRGRQCQGLAYTLQATVRSGYNDTTSGNSLINAVATAKALCAAGLTGRILVAGDDMLTAITGPTAVHHDDRYVIGKCEQVARALTEFGIKPKWGAFRDVTMTTFCSSGFYRFAGKISFLPLLGRQLAKMWWTTKDIAPSKRAAYSTAVAKGMRSVVGRVPLYREWCDTGDMGVQPLNGGLAEFERELSYKPGVGVVDAHQFSDDQALETLADRYGVPIGDLMTFRRFLKTIPRGVACAVAHPVGRIIVLHDSTDPPDRPYRIKLPP